MALVADERELRRSASEGGSVVDFLLLMLWCAEAVFLRVSEVVFGFVDRLLVSRGRRRGRREVAGARCEEDDPQLLWDDVDEGRDHDRVEEIMSRLPRVSFEEGKKFYAVRKGRVTGIVRDWEDCRKQVHRFKGAQYKAFGTVEEAMQYLSG